ncbi:hypothetical protein DIURU_001821 [Diutina rugosa]|uniref:cAMP-independent regulatory protein pac2 n=1 Tax=Diutina rugosa TaxID=5481 RepID=A0A642UUR4_DIURU|nr:uncharacterized protein DIURU_001821 [Diutina rugosa]KAA8904745.1 hypothetical protein DIURU_001821 [Diutina rugosa]
MFIIPEFNPQLDSHDSPLASVAANIITYQGRIRNVYDALLILEGTRLDILPTINRRLTPPERQQYIKPNTIFVWNETKCGMKRWTDGKLWSASKVYHGQFLIYKQLDKDKNVMPNGLIKQSFSVVNKLNHRLHLICYYRHDDQAPPRRRKRRRVAASASGEASSASSESDDADDDDEISFPGVSVPSEDERLAHLELSREIYSDTLLAEVPKRRKSRRPASASALSVPSSSASTAATPASVAPTTTPMSSTQTTTPMSSTSSVFSASSASSCGTTPPPSLAQTLMMSPPPASVASVASKPRSPPVLPVPSAPGFRQKYSQPEASALQVLDRTFTA